MNATRRSRQSLGRALARLISLVAGIYLLIPTPAQAIPAYARQFNVKCGTCHTPVPPRLNNIGIAFKRLGYRMPDVDDDGRLILQDKPSKSVFEDFSLVGDFRGESVRGEPALFKLDEVEVMGAGAVGKKLSYSAQVAWEDGEFMLEGVEGQLLLGRPGLNVTTRFGVVAPLIWDKFGHWRLGISQAALPHLRVPAGEFSGFRLHDRARGVEVGLNVNRMGTEGGNLRSTFVAAGIYNGLSQGEDGVAFEENNDFKDTMLQVVHLWGDSNTVGALWYRGRVTDIGEEAFEDRFDRVSVFGNYRFPSGTDILAGLSAGRDDTTAFALGRIDSRSSFLELNQAIGAKTSALVRYDRFEPNRDLADSDLRGPTIGVTHQLLDNLLVTGEYQGLRRGPDDRDRQFVVRAVVIY